MKNESGLWARSRANRYLGGLCLLGMFLNLSCYNALNARPVEINLATNPDAVDRVIQTTVAFVRPRSSDSPENAVYCSGFFISPRRLISATHCFQHLSLPPLTTDGMLLIFPSIENIVGEEVFFVRHGEIDLFTNQVTGIPDTAEIVFVSRRYDVAVLELTEDIEDSAFFAPFASDAPRVGEPVYGVGHPVSLAWTFSTGIVSRVIFERGNSENLFMIQATAEISPGSSGGPLFNSRGEIIGMADAFVSGNHHLGIFMAYTRIQRTIRDYWFQNAVITMTEAEQAQQQEANDDDEQTECNPEVESCLTPQSLERGD